MIEVEVLVKNVEATRLTEESSSESAVTFDVAASLTETEHEAGRFTLKYSIAISAIPPVARMDVSGTARITGEEAEIQATLTAPDQNTPPPVFMNIYQKVYAILYLLSGSLKIPYPSPGLMKVVKMASPNEVQAAKAGEKTPEISV
jgi:hypothetical protein